MGQTQGGDSRGPRTTRSIEKIRDGPRPHIIDLLDSCSPDEHQYTSGWRDRMGNAKRRGDSAHESAYALGWRDAEWHIMFNRSRPMSAVR